MINRSAAASLPADRGIIVIVFLALACAVFMPFSSAKAIAVAVVPSTFLYTFNSEGTLMEAGSSGETSSPYFWLNSGGKLLIKNGLGMTVQGALASNDATRLLYSSMNPLDTGNGYYPQNTLRLVTRSRWANSQESVQFKIVKTDVTNTPNRDGYSGVFLMGRYKDQYNLYYAGIRQDGQAVIKKKINGTYYTLGYTQVFGRQEAYDRTTNPNLMPQGKWMGLRATFINQADGSVKITMYLDPENDDVYAQTLSVVDKGTGGAPFTAAGYAGVRGDFMDLQFDNLELKKM
jgi:hypothetical protein